METKKALTLKGLTCASCAAKIEKQVKDINGVKSAYLDFANSQLVIEPTNVEEFDRIINDVTTIVKNIEPDVDVNAVDDYKNKSSKDEGLLEAEDKKKVLRLAIGSILFLIPIIFKLLFWPEFTLFLVSYLLVGSDIIMKAAKNITRGRIFDENFLMSIATIGAFSIKQFPEGVAVMLFYQIGDLFQDMAVAHSRRSITALMSIRPDYANIKVGDSLKTVPPQDVKVNDIILVRAGEKIPLDGKVVDGKSMLDTSALTGESVPREVGIGSDVLSGSINLNGLLTVKVTKEYRESTVSKILDLVQNASSKKAPTENFITKFARYYTPAIVLFAVALAVIPPIFIKGTTFSQWFYRALIFLVISCPCALVISIPLGFFGGIGGASKKGILVKGGNYLEALYNTDTVVFDKTGTLTKGVFDVTKIVPEDDFSKTELLEYAALAETYSNHPIAKSILRAYGKDIDKSSIDTYEEISGYGTRIRIKNYEIIVGKNKFMEREGIKVNKIYELGTIVHVAINRYYAGYIVISDEIKEDAKKAIESLKSTGIKKTVMFTGDTKKVANRVAEQLQFDEVYPELLPHQKVEKLEQLFNREATSRKNIVFVGDGINDAPVLARADVGIAMGGLGSDAAIEAADVVIMTDEPSKVAVAIKIAKKTMRIVWQNIIFALGIKFIVLLLGAIGIATMWEAVFADVGIAIIAVLNSIRALKV